MWREPDEKSCFLPHQPRKVSIESGCCRAGAGEDASLKALEDGRQCLSITDANRIKFRAGIKSGGRDQSSRGWASMSERCRCKRDQTKSTSRFFACHSQWICVHVDTSVCKYSKTIRLLFSLVQLPSDQKNVGCLGNFHSSLAPFR